MWQDDLYLDGYVVIDIKDKKSLDNLKTEIYHYIIGENIGDCVEAENYFNSIHKKNYSDSDINNLIKKLVFEFSKDNYINKIIFNLIQEELVSLLGVDILGQKRANFAIHMPLNSVNNSPIHRDAPENSQFEIVCWLPFVDTYGTKTMGILNKDKSMEAIKILNEKNNEEFLKFYKDNVVTAAVPYGKILLFHPNIIHGPFDNIEDESRFSINIRYKNLFTPPGDKNAMDFFEIMSMSKLTKMGIEASVYETTLK